MHKFVYIHGFNSGRNSHSGLALASLLSADVIRPEYDYSRSFAECFGTLQTQITERIDYQNDQVTLMGSSLGGFFALQLRLPALVRVVAWNPVVFPALQLEQFLGLNTKFYDGETWEFTRDALLSYAQAHDPRPWRNPVWEQGQKKFSFLGGVAPERHIFLGDRDELLDARLTRAFWEGSARLHSITSGHQILDYRHAVPLLKPSIPQ